MSDDRAHLARDFHAELMKESQGSRAGFLAERERWLRGLQVEDRDEVLFELDMLVRAIERFFRLPEASTEPQASLVSRDFSDELRAVRDAADRALPLARILLDPTTDRRLMFRKFLETTVADDRLRRDLLEAELEQRTPQESLFLLRAGLAAVRGIAEQLQKLDYTSFQSFNDVGLLALHEIALNKYFKPCRPLEFRPEYDRLRNGRVLAVIDLLEESLRKPVALAFMGLFRLLHYLRCAPGPEEPGTRRGVLVVSLVRSEVLPVAAYLEGEVAAAFAQLRMDKSAQAMRLAEDLRREVARQAKAEPASAGGDAAEAAVRARDGLAVACQQTCIELLRVFDPAMSVEAIFGSPADSAIRLRLDLSAFREICQRATTQLMASDDRVARTALEQLCSFGAYFRRVSYQMLHLGQEEAFDRFAALLAETRQLPASQVLRQRLVEDCRKFAESLDKTLTAVGRQPELAGAAFDRAAIRQLADQYLPMPG